MNTNARLLPEELHEKWARVYECLFQVLFWHNALWNGVIIVVMPLFTATHYFFPIYSILFVWVVGFFLPTRTAYLFILLEDEEEDCTASSSINSSSNRNNLNSMSLFQFLCDLFN